MNSALILNCEAYSLLSKGRKDEAELKYRECLALDPDNPDALRYLGEIIAQQSRSVEAVPILKRAVELRPDLWPTWCDLGQAMQMSAQTVQEMTEGLAYTICGTKLAEKSIKEESGQWLEFHAGIYNQALALISMGDWKRGYEFYEHGYLCNKRHLRTQKGRLWKGEYLGPESTLFVYWEGGLGDTICWTRFLPLLQEKCGANLILEVQRPLYWLFSSSRGAVEACEKIVQPNVEDLQNLPDFDYRISIQSLIYRLGLDLKDVPNKAYLFPQVAPWPLRGPQFKVGICWKGNPQHENDRNRSTTEEVFMDRLRQVEGVHFYSLTFEAKPEISIPLPIKTFLDTAAMIQAMDLIITVDTSVAHLAGAMGKEVWILLPYIATDYRWGLESIHTHLYPSARLYRQEYPGGWDALMCRVTEDLDILVYNEMHPQQRRELAAV